MGQLLIFRARGEGNSLLKGEIMLCTDCGAQNPDNAKFCLQCGKPLSGEQAFNAAPTFGTSGANFEPPSAYVPVTKLKRSRKVPIIIVGCAAVIAVFLIVLFNVTLPNTGLSGKIRHRWLCSDGAVDTYYDFKNNSISADNGISMSFDWKPTGDDRVSITMNLFGITATLEYDVSFSDDGRTMTMTESRTGEVTTYTIAD